MLNVLEAVFVEAAESSPGNRLLSCCFQGFPASSTLSAGPDVQGSLPLNRLQISIFFFCSLLGTDKD